MRRIELPWMSDEDYRLAVTTNAQRYFLGIGQTAVCGIAATGERRRGTSVPLVAFAANSELIENLSTGFASIGWPIDRIVPGQEAWASSVLQAHPSARRSLVSIAVRLPRELDMFEVDAGSLQRVRRFRSAASLPAAEHGRQRFTLGGNEDRSVAMVAAAGARVSRRGELIPDTLRRVRAEHQRQISALAVAFVCINLLAAAIAYRWRLERQLTHIVARRSAIQSTVKQAVTLRDSAELLVERIRMIAELEAAAPRWSAVLSRIAIALPEDAQLESVRTESDSVTIEGQAQDASRVLSALKGTPGLNAIRSTSSILRELGTDQMPVERWRFSMRVDHRAVARP
jgi:Tfp pilus assembly protein PilN